MESRAAASRSGDSRPNCLFATSAATAAATESLCTARGYVIRQRRGQKIGGERQANIQHTPRAKCVRAAGNT